MLSDIQTIINHHQKDHATKASRFNLFEVLRITSDEVRLHSRLLAELLDPKGAHDQGTALLDLFLDHCGCNVIFPDTSRVRVLVEHYLGVTTPTSGGRIDLLLIDDQQNAVIIENKIFAGDQENQLLRYTHFGNQLASRGGTYQLVYLTLHGTPASDKSTGKTLKEDDYSTIAYAQQIRQWLGDAITQFQHVPKLAIALEHYQQLIERLTGQNMNHALEQEIAERIIQDGQSFETAKAIANTLGAAKQRLLSQFGDDLAKRIVSTFEGSHVEQSKHFGSKWQGLELFFGESGDVDNRNAHIRFSFLSDFNDCYIEIHPGLSEMESIEKNHLKRVEYSTRLSDHFSGPKMKVQNTEKYWQGEWVCRYFKLDDRFTDLIDHYEMVMDEVLTDLKIIYKAFVQLQQQFTD